MDLIVPHYHSNFFEHKLLRGTYRENNWIRIVRETYRVKMYHTTLE